MDEPMAMWSPQRVFALLVGIVFTVIGVVGFVLTSSMKLGEVFGVFDVDLVHNIFFVVTAALAFLAVLAARPRTFNLAFGVFYLVWGLAGLIPALYFPAGTYGTDSGLFLGIMHNNVADHILHLVAGALGLLVGMLPSREARMVEVLVPEEPNRIEMP